MKNKILIPLLIIGGLAAFLSFKYSGKFERSSQAKRKIIIETVMKTIQGGHFSPRTIDDSFSVHVYNKFVNELDYSKLFFTQQDINKLAPYKFLIDDEIKNNSTEFFDTVDAIYIRRTTSAEKYYQEILAKPFTFTSNESLQLDAAKEQYATDNNALAERWRIYLKYRVLAKYIDLKNDQDKRKENKENKDTTRIKTGQELEATAREDVKKFYQDRVFKNIRKQKDDDRFTAYINVITEMEDPHTEYFPPVQKKGFDELMSGSFVGIGAQLSPANDKITVSAIITGSPSWKQGELKAGDEIQKVAQGEKPPVDIQGFEIDEVVRLIRGEKGTEVRLTVKRPDGSTKIISIIRGVVEKEETFAKSAIIKSNDGPIGYISLPEFYADFNHTSGRTCSVDIANEVKKLKEAGVAGIILDLRGNGGGSLGDVVDMAGLFIGKGPVVQVKSNHASPSVLKAQPGDSVLYSGPLAIMVNEGSASASEILAAALQDYKRAVIVGSMTYGKGTVQKMVALDDMIDPMVRLQMLNDTTGRSGIADGNTIASMNSIGALKLTMEKFYRVNGGSTQLKGVTPDITIPDVYDGYDDDELGERNRKSALPWDEIASANYKPINSIGNVQQLALLSQSRINANPTFKQIQDNSKYYKQKKDDNTVSLNEMKYKKDQDETNAKSKKLEDLLKNPVLLDMANPPADMDKINLDSASVAKNKEWLKNISKDIYISETVNIIKDLSKSKMKVNIGTGMK
ncbi:MAG: carboxy terminal-processing peptidase [Chitinophagales bacterium]